MAIRVIALLIAFSALDSLIMIVTLLRLFFRLKIRRFWWEDMWAAIMFICGMTCIVTQFVSVLTVNYNIALINMWISSLSFTSTVWAVRMSLLYSNIRIILPLSVLRKIARIMTVLFFLFWATIIILKTWWCVNNMKPVDLFGRVQPMCILQNADILFEVITDWVSDIMLVILALKLLWRVKLPQRPRRMILCLFSSSSIMSIFSLFHAICQLRRLSDLKSIAYELELTSVLIVCNLLVIVTYTYRVVFGTPNGSLPYDPETSLEDDDFTTPIRTGTMSQLTTVDLNITAGTSIVYANSHLTSASHP